MKLHRITLIATLACVALTLLFPFRTGLSYKSDYVVEFSMGQSFIGADPTPLEICEAHLNEKLTAKQVMNPSHLKSKIDYGRTIMFAGAFATVGLIALAITSTKSQLAGNGASRPFSDQRAQQPVAPREQEPQRV